MLLYTFVCVHRNGPLADMLSLRVLFLLIFVGVVKFDSLDSVLS